MTKRVQQHKKDVEYGRTGNSAIARHTEQFKHKIDWSNTECLETEKRLFPRKIIESAYIKVNRNEGLRVTTIYGKGREGWLRRKRESLQKKRQAVLFSSDLKDEPARSSKYCQNKIYQFSVNFGQSV